MTKRETLVALMDKYATDEMLVAYAQHEIELLDKKRSNGNGKQAEKVSETCELVYNALAQVGKCTASELIAGCDLTAIANDSGVVSSQKVSAYLNKLVESGKVVKSQDKKKTYFEIVG